MAPDREVLLARRIYRLPTTYKTVILQLLAKCEDLRTEECIRRHVQNAHNILGSHNSEDGYLKLPKVKTKYYFIDKKDNIKLTLDQMAKKFNKSTKTIYYWIYVKYHRLFNNYEVRRE